MFDSLSERLGGILNRLTGRGALSEADVDATLREVRRALLEADVALDVARAFIEQVKKRAVGVDVIKSVTPGQLVVKIVHDQLIETLGAQGEAISTLRRPCSVRRFASLAVVVVLPEPCRPTIMIGTGAGALRSIGSPCAPSISTSWSCTIFTTS